MKYSVGSFHVFRAPMGSELLSYIRDYAEKNHVKMGLVFAIGSIKNPKVGYFDEKSEGYITIELKGTYELLSAQGNISIKDGRPFPHVHVIVGDRTGKCFGGHLIEAEVFVAEVTIVELSGTPLERNISVKGLSLWAEER